MQLKNRPKKISGALALATTSMLTGIAAPANASSSDVWEVDSAVLYYSETNRVTVIEPVASARKEIAEDEFLSVRIVADSLSGASPNGAIKHNSTQTFTTPSGNGTYTAAANETPLDPTFQDSRGAVNAEWEKPINNTSKGIYSVNISKEFDYTSAGLAATFTWDTHQRQTTWTAGGSYSMNLINPVGGVPVGLDPMSANKATTGTSDDKAVVDLLLGVTQIISRHTLMQFNFNYGNDSGYMSDPYKILTVLDNSGNLASNPYLYEARPDTRTRQAAYWKLVHSFGSDVVHFSYRYYWDDWGISSNTLDARYRFEMGGGHYLQPHARYYIQNKADFYYYNLTEANTPTYASADYRLADMSTTTLGIKYGIEMDNNSEFNIRAEKITQTSEGDAAFEDMDAILVQLGYSFNF